MKPNNLVWATLLLGLLSLVTACGANGDGSAELSPEEARGIAKEAYVYGFPLVDVHQNRLNAVARQLNERPRATLNFEIPAERFNQCVASTG